MIWFPVLATGVGAFAAYVWHVTMPEAVRQIEEVKRRMPTKQVHFENKIRDLQGWRRAVGVVVVVEAVLSIVLWVQYAGR